MEKRPALGKGLSALIPDAPEPRTAPTEVDIDRLVPNEFQPRAHPGDERLDQLVQSIRTNGVIQPIIVRRAGDGYQIIAGERRWRAALKAGLQRVPIVVRSVPEGERRSLLEVALVENIQRQNLNPIEEAFAYRRLTEEFQLKQEDIAVAVGRDRASIANYLRLLKLPDDVRAEVASERLSMGHARALLSLTSEAEQRTVAREVIERGLSVRETEALVKRGAAGPTRPAAARAVDLHTRAAEERLRLALGTSVRIIRRGGGGRIEVTFKSEDELIRIFEQLTER
jgi:ParB family chromosome partitioning protein